MKASHFRAGFTSAPRTNGKYIYMIDKNDKPQTAYKLGESDKKKLISIANIKPKDDEAELAAIVKRAWVILAYDEKPSPVEIARDMDIENGKLVTRWVKRFHTSSDEPVFRDRLRDKVSKVYRQRHEKPLNSTLLSVLRKYASQAIFKKGWEYWSEKEIQQFIATGAPPKDAGIKKDVALPEEVRVKVHAKTIVAILTSSSYQRYEYEGLVVGRYKRWVKIKPETDTVEDE